MTRIRANKYAKVQHDISTQFHAGLNIYYLKGKQRVSSGGTARNVESLPVIVSHAQWVKFADQYFYLRKEGLYRFWTWGKIKYARPYDKPKIINDRKRYTCVILFRKDILVLLGAIATLQVHGDRHEKIVFEKQLGQLKHGNLSLTCGPVSSFMCRLLSNLGWKARPVGCIRVEGIYNTYSNGHVLFEFYWPKYRKWVLADVDMHNMFYKNGQYLNMGEVKEFIHRGQDFGIKPLTSPAIGTVDLSDAVSGRFGSVGCCEPMFASHDIMKEWYRRMFAVSCLQHDGHSYFYLDDARGRNRICRNFPYVKPMDRRDWLKRFYG